MITFPDDVLASYDRSKNYIRKTPLDYSPSLSKLIKGEVYLKLENIQKTGSSDEYIRIKMKFITRDEAKEALQRFLDDVLATEKGKGEYRIQGIKSIKFREKTLKRL